MTNTPQFAPGCFGSALAFKSADQICRQCVFRAQCEPEHYKNLQALRDKYGIKSKDRPKVLNDDDEKYPGLTAKVVEVIERLKRMDIDVKGMFKSGQNPFVGRNMFPFEFICHAALKQPDRRLEMRQIAIFFAQKLNWAPNTSAAQARIVCKALEYFDVVRCDGEQVISTLADNG